MIRFHRTLLVVSILLLTTLPGLLAAQDLPRRHSWKADSTEVASVAARYHQALASGDSAAALSMLAPDAVILESGGMETREEYRSHHLPGDIEYARAIAVERGPMRVHVRGDVAWVTSTSSARGAFRGRPISATGAELMVLVRAVEGWQIAAIHWSSRSRR